MNLNNQILVYELRVGNYIKVRSEDRTIEVENIIYNNDNVDGPLEQVNGFSTLSLERIPIYEVQCIKINTDENWKFHLISDSEDYNVTFDHIQFVDTLQNWWFFNFNEELQYENS